MNSDHKIRTNGLTTILQHDQHEQFTQVLTEFGASEVAAPTPLPGSGGYEVSERRQAARSPQSQTPSTGGGYLTPYNTQP